MARVFRASLVVKATWLGGPTGGPVGQHLLQGPGCKRSKHTQYGGN